MPTHVLVGRKPPGAVVEACRDLGRATAVRTQAFPWLPAIAAGQSGQLPQPTIDAAEPAFERLAHVEEEMPSVGDLESSGSACRRRSVVLGRAVVGDDLDVGMALQPIGDGRP